MMSERELLEVRYDSDTDSSKDKNATLKGESNSSDHDAEEGAVGGVEEEHASKSNSSDVDADAEEGAVGGVEGEQASKSNSSDVDDEEGAVGGVEEEQASSIDMGMGKGKNVEEPDDKPVDESDEKAGAATKKCTWNGDFRCLNISPWDLDYFKSAYFELGYDQVNAEMPEIDSVTLAKYEKDFETREPHRNTSGQPYNGFQMYKYVARTYPQHCALHNCKSTVSPGSIFGHYMRSHFNWFEGDYFKKKLHCIFQDNKVKVPVDETQCIFGQICSLGILTYGGDRNNEPPGNLGLCPKNSIVPSYLLSMEAHLPIILMALKVPASMNLIECRRKKALLSQREDQTQPCDESEKLIIWASSYALPYKLQIKMLALNRENQIVQFKKMNVRYYEEVTQNPYEFAHYDTDFLTLSYKDLQLLTNNFERNFYLYFSIEELPEQHDDVVEWIQTTFVATETKTIYKQSNAESKGPFF